MRSFATDLGLCGIRWSDQGLTGVLMPGARTLADPPTEPLEPRPAFVDSAIDGIVELLSGGSPDLRDVVLDWRVVDDFRRRVFESLRAIGPGELVSYGRLASSIGAPGGARAVGRALGSNPWPIVVPCHRVVAADGALTGFSSPGGVQTKRRMLEIECAPGYAQRSLFV
jgi:methylated-DNA-[protein]-cysteine S-methyltransferase